MLKKDENNKSKEISAPEKSENKILKPTSLEY